MNSIIAGAVAIVSVVTVAAVSSSFLACASLIPSDTAEAAL